MREENFMQQFGWMNGAEPIRILVWKKQWLYKNFASIILEIEDFITVVHEKIKHED